MFNIKSLIKSSLRYILSERCPPIVVSSTGRAGSTMLHDSIVSSYFDYRFAWVGNFIRNSVLNPVFSIYIDRLEDINSSMRVIYKTHDIYREDKANAAKYIFIHGDPLESAISVAQMTERYGMSWFDEHQHHLCAIGSYDNLYEEDVLNYQNQIETWSKSTSQNVLCVAYEDLWDEVDNISRHVGFKVILPEKRERSDKVCPDNINIPLFAKLRSLRDRSFSRHADNS